MFAEGIFPIGDGLLDIDEERLKDLLVPHDINEIYEVEQTPFARYEQFSFAKTLVLSVYRYVCICACVYFLYTFGGKLSSCRYTKVTYFRLFSICFCWLKFFFFSITMLCMCRIHTLKLGTFIVVVVFVRP